MRLTPTLFVLMLVSVGSLDLRAADEPAVGQPGGPGAGGGGGRQGRGGGGAWGGGGQGGGWMNALMGRLLGIEIPDNRPGAKLEALPLGNDRRMIMNIPIGGIDLPGSAGNGLKMESIFKLNEQQTTTLDAMRDEYKSDQKKLEKEISEQQKVLVEKAKALRLKYEQRANELLSADDKAAKEKIDALTKETNDKNAKAVADIMPLYEGGDQTAMAKAIRDKTVPAIELAGNKLIELMPAESKELIQGMINQQTETRATTLARVDNAGNWGGGGGAGGAGGGGRRRGGNAGDAQTPPRPPDQNF